MNLQNWSESQILQLPDHFFGQRYAVHVEPFAEEPGQWWDISEIALPDVCVLWEIFIGHPASDAASSDVRIALGDQLPITIAQFDALDPLMPGLGQPGAEPRTLTMNWFDSFHLTNLRRLIRPQGRRLVAEISSTNPEVRSARITIVISSLPTFVPDYLFLLNHSQGEIIIEKLKKGR